MRHIDKARRDATMQRLGDDTKENRLSLHVQTFHSPKHLADLMSHRCVIDSSNPQPRIVLDSQW
jgi:hypothetical protein